MNSNVKISASVILDATPLYVTQTVYYTTIYDKICIESTWIINIICYV